MHTYLCWNFCATSTLFFLCCLQIKSKRPCRGRCDCQSEADVQATGWSAGFDKKETVTCLLLAGTRPSIGPCFAEAPLHSGRPAAGFSLRYLCGRLSTQEGLDMRRCIDS